MVEIAIGFVVGIMQFAAFVAWLLIRDARARVGSGFWDEALSNTLIDSCRVQIVELVEGVAVVRELRSYPLPHEYREAA